MGIKNIFKKRDPTEEEIKEHMQKAGILTKTDNDREEKFGAFKQYAEERRNHKKELAPKNPYANLNYANNNANYSQDGDVEQGNPYGVSVGENDNSSYANGYGSHPYGSGQNSNPYGGGYNTNPYGGGGREIEADSGINRAQNIYDKPLNSSNPQGNGPRGTSYGRPSARSGGNRNVSRQRADPRGASRRSGNVDLNDTASVQTDNPYSSSRVPKDVDLNDAASVQRGNQYTSSRTTKDIDLNDAASIDPYGGYAPSVVDREEVLDGASLNLNATTSRPMSIKGPTRKTRDSGSVLDLNDLPEDDLNEDLDELGDLPEEPEYNSEDEEVEGIKQNIRSVKQDSLASTRNTMRMAQEADSSAVNTLGMLGSQSERLYNTEQNLLLADTQTNIADEKIRMIEKYNRSIFVPVAGNPFNRKSRLRQQEMRIKGEKTREKALRETHRRDMYDSEHRIKEGISQHSMNSELYQKYQGERDLEAARKYQFENDSEDDEIEKELASNLNQIGLYSKKLKNSAVAMGSEVGNQNDRLRRVEDDADRLDINVHANNTMLSGIH